MDEAQLTACVFQKMLDTVFLTEHNMARQLGLSYKVLRRDGAAYDPEDRRCHGATAAILCAQSDPIGSLPLGISLTKKRPL